MEDLLLARCMFRYRYWRILPVPGGVILEPSAIVGNHNDDVSDSNFMRGVDNMARYRTRWLRVYNFAREGQLGQLMNLNVALGGEILHMPMAAARKLLYPTSLMGADLQAAVEGNAAANCVITYILYELHETPNSRLKSMTREKLVKAIAEAYAAAQGRSSDEDMNVDETGMTLTLAHVLAWIRTREDISLYALDFLWHPVVAHRAPAARVYLFILVNNGHCYGVLDTDIRYSVARRVTPDTLDEDTAMVDAGTAPLPAMKAIDVRAPDMHDVYMVHAPTYDDRAPLTFEQLEEVDEHMVQPRIPAEEVVEDMKARVFEEADAADAATVVLPVSNLQEYMIHVVRACGVVPEQVGVRDTHIYAFRHPAKGTLYLIGDDFDARKHVVNTLHAQYQLVNFEWTNQTWASIAGTVLDILVGPVPESNPNTEVATLLNTHPVRAYMWSSGAITTASEHLHSVDTRRAYTSALLREDLPWPVFDTLDSPEPVTGTDWIAETHGEAYVARTTVAARGCMLRPAGWYPMVWIRHALERGYITPDDITHRLQPRRVLPGATFAPFVHAMLDTFPDESKFLVNALVGVWTGMHSSKTTIAVTTDLDTVTRIVGPRMTESENTTSLQPKVVYSVYHADNLHIVYEHTRRTKRSHHLPLARRVLASAWVHLDVIATTVVSPWATILCIKTDAVLFAGEYDATQTRLKKEALPGQYHVEPVPPGAGMFGPRTETLVLRAPPSWTETSSSITRMHDDIPWHSSGGALVLGPPGSGKSYEILRATSVVDDVHNDSHLLHGRRGIVVCYTHAGCERIKADGGRAHTIKSILFDVKTGRDDVHRLLDYDVVIVDEYTMLPPQLVGLLLTAKRMKPEMTLFLVGDPNQCHAPVPDWTYYESRSAVLQACGNTVVTLSYKGHRYDGAMHVALQRFCSDGILTSGWRRCEGGHPQERFAITRTNACRKRINAERWQQWIACNAPPVLYQQGDLQYAIGCVLMCYHDTIKECGVYKTQRYRVSAVNATHVTLQRMHWDPSRPLEPPLDVPVQTLALFSHAFAATVEKIQGVTLYEPYSVYECTLMDRNVLYTALSRGRTLRDVCIVPPMGRGIWTPARPPPSISLKVTPPVRTRAHIFELTYETTEGDGGIATELVASRSDDAHAVTTAFCKTAHVSVLGCVHKHSFEYVAKGRHDADDMDTIQDALAALEGEDVPAPRPKPITTILVSDKRLRLDPEWRATSFNILHDTSKRRYIIRCRNSIAPVHLRFPYTDAASQATAYAAAVLKRDELRLVPPASALSLPPLEQPGSAPEHQ